MTEPVTLVLGTPIERRSARTGAVVDRIAELRFRPLLLGDLTAALDAAGAGNQGALMLQLAARSAGIAAEDLAGLGIGDGMAVMEAMQGFMPAGLQTGTNGAPSSPASSALPPIGANGVQPT
ncbi:MAG TPA: phage tail assembly protein [Roseomonas sp.]